MTSPLRIVSAFGGLILLSLTLVDCSEPVNPGARHQNVPPETRLANIPVDDSLGAHTSATPTVALFWIGDDPDGFVTGFRYRWSYREGGTTVHHKWTTILNLNFRGFTLRIEGDVGTIPDVHHHVATLSPQAADSVTAQLTQGKAVYIEGDSIVAADPKENVNPNKGVFIFESRDTLNPHTFEVRALDNEGAEDPVSASVTFWTPRALPPDTRVIGPFPADSSFMIDRITETFSGLRFYFEGIDQYSKNLEYSWSIDSLRWSAFSSEQSAVVTAADLKKPYTGTHTLYVKARNDYSLEDTTPASHKFTVVVPSFIESGSSRRMLVLNATRNGSGLAGNPTNAQLNAFYRPLLDSVGRSNSYDIWTVKTQGFPSRVAISSYSAILLFNDNYLGDLTTRLSTDRAALLSDYLAVGGKMIISSWLLPLASDLSDNDDNFFVNRIHLYTVRNNQLRYYQVNYDLDCIGGFGKLGYPEVTFDTTKMPSTWNNAMSRMAGVSPRGFAEVIYQFNSKIDSLLFEKRSMGVRYLGVTYSVVYFGFPLYFVPQSTAAAVLRKAVQDIGE